MFLACSAKGLHFSPSSQCICGSLNRPCPLEIRAPGNQSLAEMGLRGGRVAGVENMDEGEWQVTIPPEATACSCHHRILLVGQSAAFTQGSPKSPGGNGGSHLKELRRSWGRGADVYHRQHLSGIQKKKMNTGRIWPCCIVLTREGGKEGRRMEGG